jgi:hypothetical protein
VNSYTLKCSVCIPEEWTVDDILNAANVVLGDDMRMATGDRVSGLCLLSVTYYAFDEMAGETKARVLKSLLEITSAEA